jgi:hypothetical protein
MPKENINDMVTDGFRAEVTWRPDPGYSGYVQVATVNLHSTLTLPGTAPVEDGDAEPEKFDGWYVTLDRDGINRMIRCLKRARDQAFGHDE